MGNVGSAVSERSFGVFEEAPRGDGAYYLTDGEHGFLVEGGHWSSVPLTGVRLTHPAGGGRRARSGRVWDRVLAMFDRSRAVA